MINGNGRFLGHFKVERVILAPEGFLLPNALVLFGTYDRNQQYGPIGICFPDADALALGRSLIGRTTDGTTVDQETIFGCSPAGAQWAEKFGQDLNALVA